MTIRSKKTLYLTEKHSERVQEKRWEYWHTVREINQENLVFVDESGSNLAMVRLYGRAKIGDRIRGEQPQKRGRNVSMVTAISLKEVVASRNIYGCVDGLTFEAFVVRGLIAKLWAGACVIMDNAKIHLGETIREEIEKVRASFVYLSPYSPDFSPIENFWSKVKNQIRKLKPRNYNDLVEGIATAMEQVTQFDIHS
ncbi:mobile element protein [Geminocystis sp. NIES-3708]|nr:mobile element protein [Geminocystis sp. NIES-3708]